VSVVCVPPAIVVVGTLALHILATQPGTLRSGKRATYPQANRRISGRAAGRGASGCASDLWVTLMHPRRS
jgi:hypothetical protein